MSDTDNLILEVQGLCATYLLDLELGFDADDLLWTATLRPAEGCQLGKRSAGSYSQQFSAAWVHRKDLVEVLNRTKERIYKMVFEHEQKEKA